MSKYKNIYKQYLYDLLVPKLEYVDTYTSIDWGFMFKDSDTVKDIEDIKLEDLEETFIFYIDKYNNQYFGFERTSKYGPDFYDWLVEKYKEYTGENYDVNQ